ncbi:hypothetical protein SAMN04490200_4257 [Pseudomonas proteolytica]|nr:hypothetical protein SAMN04490200_4257 [Pseudomonas proteolytica]
MGMSICTTLWWFLGLGTYPLLRLRRLLVPPLRRLTFVERKSKQNALAPPLGASPRLGMPAVRHCSVGPPRSAIHGRVAATPASCRGAHCAIPACGQRDLMGRLRSKARSKAEQQQQQQQRQSAELLSPVGAGLLANAECQSIHLSTDRLHSRASPLPQGYAHASTIRSAVRPPRFACDFDLRRPIKPRWP